MMLEAVAGVLRRRRSEGWLVGGTVRDRECGYDSPDLDLVVADDPAAVAREIADRLASSWFALSARHGAYRVMGDKGHIDVAGIRGGGILHDLGQRDFTINAMATPVSGGELIDPFGGLTHLREQRLVAVSERIFIDDPLRLMRAARFCHVLGMRIDSTLEKLLRSQASELGRVAPERVAAEMILTLSKRPSAAVPRLWDRLGLLEVALPEVTSAWGQTSPAEPFPGEPEKERADGRDHSRRAAVLPAGLETTEGALERLDHALSHLSSWFPQSAPAVLKRLAGPVDGAWSRAAALRLAVITYRLPPQQVQAAARRLRLSAAMLCLLRSVSECFSVGRCSSGTLQEAVRSPRAEVLFLWDSAPWEPESILLAACVAGLTAFAPTAPRRAGRSGAVAPRQEGAQADLDLGSPVALMGNGVLDPARKLMALWADRSVGAAPPLPVDGETLMRELDLIPGPRLGEVLREVRLAWEAEEVKTAGEAMNLARALLRKALEVGLG